MDGNRRKDGRNGSASDRAGGYATSKYPDSNHATEASPVSSNPRRSPLPSKRQGSFNTPAFSKRFRPDTDGGTASDPIAGYAYEKTTRLDSVCPSNLGTTPFISSTPKDDPTLYEQAQFPGMPPLPLIKGPEELKNGPFTHPSLCDSSAGSYERLEFLGDSYLELFATRLIFSRFPHLPVGRMSKLREQLVRNETLARFSRAYGFPGRVKMASNAPKGTAEKQVKMAADVFEAYVAALAESDGQQGMARLDRWLTELWADMILGLSQSWLNAYLPTSAHITAKSDETSKAQSAAPTQGANGASKADPEDTPLVDEAISSFDEAKGSWKVVLHGLINGTKDEPTRIEYLPERFKKLSDNHEIRVTVFVTGLGYKTHPLGSAVGLGQKEAGTLAARNALFEHAALTEDLARRALAARQRKNEKLEAARLLAKTEAVENTGPHVQPEGEMSSVASAGMP